MTTVPKRILVVDDHQDSADLLAEIVRSQGHSVTVAHDPERALELLAEVQPEIAVLDIGLPGMDGYQLGARVREKFPSCRLIALTGYGEDIDRTRTTAAGFAGHLVKPVKLAKLMQMISPE
jgi:CheY-like chemotaxis protein